MKKAEYIEKYPFGTRCRFTPTYINEEIAKLRKKLDRTGDLLQKNYRTRKVRVAWDDTATSVLYNINSIEKI